jgi:hypothetical protein
MKFLVATIGLFLSPSAVWASAAINPIVECSTISVATNAPFDACATWARYGPSPAEIDGKLIYMGGYATIYKIVTGLKEGVDTTALSESDLKKAYSKGIGINVARDDNDKCTVTVNVKDESKVCSSCTFCGNDRYSADCTALKHGRNVTYESTGEGQVFFPFSKSALECSSSSTMKAPVAVTAKDVRAPAAAPKVRAPVKAPIKAPIKAQVKAPVKAPIKAPIKAVKAPIKAPVKAPVKLATAVKSPSVPKF